MPDIFGPSGRRRLNVARIPRGLPMSISKSPLQEIRESLLMSKAELARKAHVSPITITRIEKGMPCRMETQRKILLALGMNLTEKNRIFNNLN
jgi:DNA-binding XRE family transcriptional regulator